MQRLKLNKGDNDVVGIHERYGNTNTQRVEPQRDLGYGDYLDCFETSRRLHTARDFSEAELVVR